MIPNLLKKIDFFYTPVKVKFKNQALFNSALGGILTILITVISIVLFISTGNSLFYREKPEINNYDIYRKQGELKALNDSTLVFAFFLQDNNNKPLEIDSYFNITLNQFYRHKNLSSINNSDSAYINKRINLGYSRCSENRDTQMSKFNYYVNFTEDLNINYFDYWLCLSDKAENAVIGGEYNSDFFSNIYLEISTCANNTQNLNNGIICKSDHEINTILKNSKLKAFYIQNSSNGNNYKDPFISYFSNYYVVLDSVFSVETNLYFNQLVVTTDDGIIFESINNKTRWFLDNFREQRVFINDNGSRRLLRLYINSGFSTSIVKRYYMKIQELLAFVGGFAKAIIAISIIICEFFNQYLFDESMINTFFVDGEIASPKLRKRKSLDGNNKLIINNLANELSAIRKLNRITTGNFLNDIKFQKKKKKKSTPIVDLDNYDSNDSNESGSNNNSNSNEDNKSNSNSDRDNDSNMKNNNYDQDNNEFNDRRRSNMSKISSNCKQSRQSKSLSSKKIITNDTREININKYSNTCTYKSNVNNENYDNEVTNRNLNIEKTEVRSKRSNSYSIKNNIVDNNSINTNFIENSNNCNPNNSEFDSILDVNEEFRNVDINNIKSLKTLQDYNIRVKQISNTNSNNIDEANINYSNAMTINKITKINSNYNNDDTEFKYFRYSSTPISNINNNMNDNDIEEQYHSNKFQNYNNSFKNIKANTILNITINNKLNDKDDSIPNISNVNNNSKCDLLKQLPNNLNYINTKNQRSKSNFEKDNIKFDYPIINKNELKTNKTNNPSKIKHIKLSNLFGNKITQIHGNYNSNHNSNSKPTSLYNSNNTYTNKSNNISLNSIFNNRKKSDESNHNKINNNIHINNNNKENNENLNFENNTTQKKVALKRSIDLKTQRNSGFDFFKRNFFFENTDTLYHLNYCDIFGMTFCKCSSYFSKKIEIHKNYLEKLYKITDFEEIVNEIALFREFRENSQKSKTDNNNINKGIDENINENIGHEINNRNSKKQSTISQLLGRPSFDFDEYKKSIMNNKINTVTNDNSYVNIVKTNNSNNEVNNSNIKNNELNEIREEDVDIETFSEKDTYKRTKSNKNN